MDPLTLAHVVDRTAVALALGLPVLFVWRWRWVGVLVGALLLWGILAAVGPILSSLDPSREAGMLDAIWIGMGWLAGLVYSSFLWIAFVLIRRLLRLGSRAHEPAETRAAL